MRGMTMNEARAVDFLIRHARERTSINGIARQLRLSPNGAYRLLKRLEAAQVIVPERIGNAVYFRMDLESELGRAFAEAALLQHDLNSYARAQAESLLRLKGQVSCCILFGSVLGKGNEAHDIDVLLVLRKRDYRKAQALLDELGMSRPKKIHPLFQTPGDFIRNIRKNDEIVLDILKNGAVLWGAGVVVEAIRRGSS